MMPRCVVNKIDSTFFGFGMSSAYIFVYISEEEKCNRESQLAPCDTCKTKNTDISQVFVVITEILHRFLILTELNFDRGYPRRQSWRAILYRWRTLPRAPRRPLARLPVEKKLDQRRRRSGYCSALIRRCIFQTAQTSWHAGCCLPPPPSHFIPDSRYYL